MAMPGGGDVGLPSVGREMPIAARQISQMRLVGLSFAGYRFIAWGGGRFGFGATTQKQLAMRSQKRRT